MPRVHGRFGNRIVFASSNIGMVIHGRKLNKAIYSACSPRLVLDIVGSSGERITTPVAKKSRVGNESSQQRSKSSAARFREASLARRGLQSRRSWVSLRSHTVDCRIAQPFQPGESMKTHVTRMASRTYRYFNGKPLYPFGYGLSYTKFNYSDLNVPSQSVAAGQPIGEGSAPHCSP
jgi:hypothetical protein